MDWPDGAAPWPTFVVKLSRTRARSAIAWPFCSVQEEITGLVEAQKEVSKDVVRQQTELAHKSSGLRNELEKNFEMIQKLRTKQKEAMSRQTEPTVARKTLRL